jgi:uncharacterized membrane protein
MIFSRVEQVRVCVGFCIAITLARRGIRKKSLDLSGAIAAFFVGFITFASGYRFGKENFQ